MNDFALDICPSVLTLKKRAEFLFVAQGQRASGRFLSLQARENKASRPAIGFGITASKKVGNAVHRNLAKRRLREVFRQTLPQFAKVGVDYVAIARPQTCNANYKDLLDEVKFLVKRLSNKNPTQPKANKANAAKPAAT